MPAGGSGRATSLAETLAAAGHVVDLAPGALPRRGARAGRRCAAGPLRRALTSPMPIDVHHEVYGPADAPAVVLELARRHARDVGSPARRPRRLPRRAVRPARPRRLAGAGRPQRDRRSGRRPGTALLDRLEIARASLVGVSLGGMVSLWTAAHHPDRVERLAPVLHVGPARPAADVARPHRDGEAEGTGALADAVVGRWFTPAFAAREPDYVAGMRDTIAATPAAGYASCAHAIETITRARRAAAVYRADARRRRQPMIR